MPGQFATEWSGQFPRNSHKDTITEAEFQELLAKKIDTVKMDYVINDIKRFIKDANKLAIWSPKYFHDLVNNLKVVS